MPEARGRGSPCFLLRLTLLPRASPSQPCWWEGCLWCFSSTPRATPECPLHALGTSSVLDQGEGKGGGDQATREGE